MESIEIRCHSVLRALENLREGLDHAREGNSTKFSKSLNNGLVQCFEYSIEEVWKLCGAYLQEVKKTNLTEPYLEEVGKVKSEKLRSKDILKSAEEESIISKREYDHLLTCIRDRNFSSHGYSSQIVIDILLRIPEHYQVMKTVVDRIYQKIMNETNQI